MKRLWLIAALQIGASLFWATPAVLHEWYPMECCSGMDCAPVISSSWVAGATFEHGQRSDGIPLLVVTTQHGTAVVPQTLPRRESKDGRMHACIRTAGGAPTVICIFVPPSM